MSFLFLILSIVCFVLAAFGFSVSRVAIGWLGLAFLAASFAV